MIKWEDITSYSKSNKTRTPRVLCASINGLEVIVHKHIYYGEKWLLTSHELNLKGVPLDTNDFKKAKEYALQIINGVLKTLTERYSICLTIIKEEGGDAYAES